MVCPRALLIIDDLLAIPPDKGLDLLQDYLLMHSHHQQLSVLFTVQNPFVRPTRQLDLVTLSRQVLFSISKNNNFFLRRNMVFFSSYYSGQHPYRHLQPQRLLRPGHPQQEALPRGQELSGALHGEGQGARVELPVHPHRPVLEFASQVHHHVGHFFR